MKICCETKVLVYGYNCACIEVHICAKYVIKRLLFGRKKCPFCSNGCTKDEYATCIIDKKINKRNDFSNLFNN